MAFTDNSPTNTSGKTAFIADVEQQLQRYFLGKLKDFNITFSSEGTPFQEEVWQKLLEIPYGRTISYAKLAAGLGDVKKIRAVANAVGKNPIPIIIPCHRVVGKNGALTGYLGGLKRKKQLIELEGYKQLQLF